MQRASLFLWRDVPRLPKRVMLLWNRRYEDARIILEQGGDLHYLSIPASLQRNSVRVLIVMAASALTAIAALVLTSVALHLAKQKLENSHRDIYAALISSTQDMELGRKSSMSSQDMVSLAQSIRDRDQEIRRMVGIATDRLSDENASLAQRLASSGLTEKAIKVIQSHRAAGGPVEGTDRALDPLLQGDFMDVSAKNRDLMDILVALPHQIPVNDHRLTSSYGIRTHPISGRPSFHAGIDLVPDNDDRVFPSLPGKVIVARPYNNYGNTVIVRHERGVETLYAHLADIRVKEGQEVDTSDVLGMVGNTGASTGKHLHFEVSIGGYPVDPLKVIATAQYVQQAKVEPR